MTHLSVNEWPKVNSKAMTSKAKCFSPAWHVRTNVVLDAKTGKLIFVRLLPFKLFVVIM